jgi:hypothetical protein
MGKKIFGKKGMVEDDLISKIIWIIFLLAGLGAISLILKRLLGTEG